MQAYTPSQQKNQRLRAIVDIIDGKLVIYPLAETDEERQQILAAFGGPQEQTA